MARIRTIKPDFFTSEDIVCLTPRARLLYIALWCEADREGRLVWKPNTFKLRYFPGDKIGIEDLCDELTGRGLVVLYGAGYAHIPTFLEHQHVNPRETDSNIPAPDGVQALKPGGAVRGKLRQEIIDRDGGQCVRCKSDQDIEIDHILPISLGGPSVAENLRVLCGKCNAGRPVGAGLEDDLKRDGLTLTDLLYRFARVATRGDASNLDKHAQVGRERKEGKGKERKEVARDDTRAASDADAPSPGGPVNGNAVAYIPLNDGSDFGVSKELAEELGRLYPRVDVPQTLNEIRGWNIAKKSRRKTRRGVLSHINGWFAKEQNRGP